MNNLFEGKKIIMAMTADVKLFNCFYDNLVFLGFEVVQIDNLKPKFKYKNLKDRLVNFFRKNILNDREYKIKLREKYYLEYQLAKINTIKENFDFALVIRADLFEEEIIKLIAEKSNAMYGYQWDGLSRYSDIYSRIPLFKKFYVFDSNDISEVHDTYPITNFYFDCYSSIFENKKPKYDVYYLGTLDNRIDYIIETCEKLNALGLQLDIKIRANDLNPKPFEKYSYIDASDQEIKFSDNIKNISNAKMILDFNHENLHHGLSLRSFEALGYGKKLISTNKLIKEYDFYEKTQFYIFDDNDKSLENFIGTPITPVEEKIKYKYSFTNWISYVLEQENNIPIEFPK